MSLKDNIRSAEKSAVIKHIMERGFSLAEVLIIVACVIVIAILCLQVLKKIIPDKDARMFKKAYNLTARLVPSMAHDDELYPEVEGNNAPQYLGNTEWVIYQGKKYEGSTKFCGLFAAKINALSEISCNARASLDGKATLTTNDGVVWVLPITEFKDLKTPGIIQIDTNGAKKPNKEGADRYKIYVYQDGTVSDKPVDMPDLPAIPDDPNNPGSSSSGTSSSSSGTSSGTSSSSSGTSSSSSSGTSSGTSSSSSGTSSSSSSGTSSSSSGTSSSSSSGTSMTSNTSISYNPERSLGFSGGSVVSLCGGDIPGNKKKAWKTVIPSEFPSDRDYFIKYIGRYYDQACNRAGVDLTAVYNAYIRVQDLYVLMMQTLYNRCASDKPLEKGRGEWISLSTRHPYTGQTITYKGAYRQDDDGKEFKKAPELWADRHSISRNELGLELQIKRDRKYYWFMFNTACFTAMFQKFYEEELDRMNK